MELEINGRKYQFKDKCTMVEYIASYNTKVQMGLKSQVNLVARMSQEPYKVSAKELMMMDASEVLKLIKATASQYGMLEGLDFLEKE